MTPPEAFRPKLFALPDEAFPPTYTEFVIEVVRTGRSDCVNAVDVRCVGGAVAGGVQSDPDHVVLDRDVALIDHNAGQR